MRGKPYKIIFIVLIMLYFLSILIMSCGHSMFQKKAADVFEDIHAKVPSIELLDMDHDKQEIEGHYSTFGQSMKKYEQGSLYQANLYIFHDGTYIYTQSSDILKETVFDKGKWIIENSFIKFISDNSLKKEPSLEVQYLPFWSETKTLLLMGLPTNFKNFERADHDYYFIMLMNSFERVSTIKAKDTDILKATILNNCFIPWYFEKGFPQETLKIYSFKKADVVAVIKTISGHQIPIDKGGGIQVRAKIIYPIKGSIKVNDELDIFYAACNLGYEYIANLVWSKELNGYKYYYDGLDIPVCSYKKYEDTTYIHDSMKAFGLKGTPILIDSMKYYLPDCNSKCDPYCQNKFEFVQYMLEQKEPIGEPDSGWPR